MVGGYIHNFFFQNQSQLSIIKIYQVVHTLSKSAKLRQDIENKEREHEISDYLPIPHTYNPLLNKFIPWEYNNY